MERKRPAIGDISGAQFVERGLLSVARQKLLLTITTIQATLGILFVIVVILGWDDLKIVKIIL